MCGAVQICMRFTISSLPFSTCWYAVSACVLSLLSNCRPCWPMAKQPSAEGRILLITNNLPPVRGGSGIVYDALAREAGGRIIVIAPRNSYQDGLPLIGWREHD